VSATVTAWDTNALFSPGDQDFWVNIWAHPDKDTPTGSDDWLISKFLSTGDQREWGIIFEDTGDLWNVIGSSDGASGTNVQAGTTAIVEETWQQVFLQFDSSGNLLGIRVNNGALETTALGEVFQGTGGLTIGGFTGGSNYFHGRLDAVMMGTAAHGFADSGDFTFTKVAELLYNNGYGVKHDDLSTAQKDGIGLVDMWDMETNFTSKVNSIALNENGGIASGAVDGVGYSAGLVATWENQAVLGSNDFSQATIAKRPEFHNTPKTASGGDVFGGNPGVRFDGTDDLLVEATAGGFLTGDKGAVFALVHLDAEPAALQVVCGSSDEAGAVKYMLLSARHNDAGNNQMSAASRNGTTDSQGGTISIVQDTNYIMGWFSDGTVWTFRLDKAPEPVANDIAGNNDGDWFATSADKDNVTIGAWKSNTEASFLNGWLGMLIVLDGALASAKFIKSVEKLFTDYSNGIAVQ